MVMSGRSVSLTTLGALRVNHNITNQWLLFYTSLLAQLISVFMLVTSFSSHMRIILELKPENKETNI